MAEKILILEDDPFLSKAYITILSKEGYDVEQFPNGKAGLDAVKTESFDIILLDMLMPEMSGIDFLRIFEPKKHPETKVIIFSNMSTPDTIKEAIELGAAKYLTKATFSPKQMVKIIHEVLEKKEK
jgi:DNA-binding response OmpR family regulator